MNWVQAHYVGLRTPRPRFLFFYEKRNQKRIKEEVSSLISPQGGSLPRSNRKAVTLPLVYHESFESHWGCREGAEPPSAGNPKTRRFLVYLCLLSLHKKVGAVWSAQLHKKHIQLNITKSLHRSCRDFLFILLYPNNLVQTSGISGFSRIVTL